MSVDTFSFVAPAIVLTDELLRKLHTPCRIGIVKDAASAIVPLILMSKGLLLLLLKALVALLIILRFLKKKIKRVRVVPPPPVWTLVKMPPPIVDLMAIVLTPALLNLLNNIVLEVKPVISVYAGTFAKLAADWLKEHGVEELDRQFEQVMDPEHPRVKVSLSKFIRRFHKGACVHTYRSITLKLKELAQKMYNEATRVATIVAETKRAVAGGDDLMAAATSVVDPAMIKKLTDLTGPLGPVLNEYLKTVVKAPLRADKDKDRPPHPH